MKEAKVHGSWINPDEPYDAAVQAFVSALLDPAAGGPFLAAFAALAGQVAFFGQVNSLAQVALKLTSPGMPDIYQGNELWDFSLVDPDSRRPVDYERRREMLEGLPDPGEVDDGFLADLLANSHDGRVKLYLTRCLLEARRSHPELFRTSDYRPLAVSGEAAEARHCVRAAHG